MVDRENTGRSQRQQVREWAERGAMRWWEEKAQGGERAQAETGKGEREQRGRLGRGGGSTPIMHVETGHSDSMRTVGNLPEHIHVMGQVHSPKP